MTSWNTAATIPLKLPNIDWPTYNRVDCPPMVQEGIDSLESGSQEGMNEAYSSFLMSAMKGSSIAAYYLGFCLMKGIGCEEDPIKAFSQWMNLKRDFVVCRALRLCYEHGIGTAQNPEVARDMQSLEASMTPIGYTSSAATGSTAARQSVGTKQQPFNEPLLNGYNRDTYIPKPIGTYFSGNRDTAGVQKAFEQETEAVNDASFRKEFQVEQMPEMKPEQAEEQVAPLVRRQEESAVEESFSTYNTLAYPVTNPVPVIHPVQNQQQEVKAKVEQMEQQKVEQTAYQSASNQRGTEETPSQQVNQAEVNESKLFSQYLQEAQTGDTSAQILLAHMYRKGSGTSMNTTEAFRLYYQAAESRDAEALFEVGLCYENGRGATKDLETAIRWYKAAHAAENPNRAPVIQRCQKLLGVERPAIASQPVPHQSQHPTNAEKPEKALPKLISKLIKQARASSRHLQAQPALPSLRPMLLPPPIHSQADARDSNRRSLPGILNQYSISLENVKVGIRQVFCSYEAGGRIEHSKGVQLARSSLRKRYRRGS